MGQEKFFRLLSIAILGLMALAFMPEPKAEPVVVESVKQIPQSPEIEAQAVLEVNEINADRFRPFIAGESGDSGVVVSDLDLMPSTHIAQ